MWGADTFETLSSSFMGIYEGVRCGQLRCASQTGECCPMLTRACGARKACKKATGPRSKFLGTRGIFFSCAGTVWGQLITWLCQSLSHYFDFGTHRDILDTCLISREVKLSLIMFGQLIMRMRYNMIAILHNFHKHCTKQWMQKMSDASVFVQTGLNHWWWSKNTHNQTFTTGSLSYKMQALLFSSSCFVFMNFVWVGFIFSLP